MQARSREGAIKLARQLHGASRHCAFPDGFTAGPTGIELTGSKYEQRAGFASSPQVYHVPYGMLPL